MAPPGPSRACYATSATRSNGASTTMQPIRTRSRCGSRRSRAMKIHQEKHRLQVTDSDLSGSVYDDMNLSGSSYENVNMSGGTYHNVNLSGSTFDDLNMLGWHVHHVNLSGLKIDRANLAGASIVNSRLDGMTIDGIEVTELLAAWKAKNAA